MTEIEKLKAELEETRAILLDLAICANNVTMQGLFQGDACTHSAELRSMCQIICDRHNEKEKNG